MKLFIYFTFLIVMSNYPTIYTSSASPQVVLGDTITGLGSDDARQGFRKYNNHIHLPFSSTDFFTYNIAIADEVFLYDDNGINIFNGVDPPVIEFISHNALRINTTSSLTIKNKLLYVKAPLEDIDSAILISGIDLEENSNLITFNADTPRSGFLTPEQYKILANKQVNHSFNLIKNNNFTSVPLIISVDNSYWLKSLSLFLNQGSVKGYLKVTRDATGLILNSDYINVTANNVNNTRFTEDNIDSNIVPFSGLITSPLQQNDIVEFVFSDITFPDQVSQLILTCTLNLLHVL